MAEIIISGYSVLVDDEDVERIHAMGKWKILIGDLKKGYYYFRHNIYKDKKCTGIKLHRYIMELEIGNPLCVDHINHNTLDNRKCNLRVCTRGENTRNGVLHPKNNTGYKGVRYYKATGRYKAEIEHLGVSIFLGYSDDPIECAKKYDLMAQYLFKEYACINFPDIPYDAVEADLLYKKATKNWGRKDV